MSAGIRRDVVILACAISAGVHGALAPEHFGEGTGAGLGFVASTVALALTAYALTRHANAALMYAAAFQLTSLIVIYGLAVTTGVPLLHPAPEPVTTVAVVTKAIEAAGVVAALRFRQSQERGTQSWKRHAPRVLSRSS